MSLLIRGAWEVKIDAVVDVGNQLRGLGFQRR